MVKCFYYTKYEKIVFLLFLLPILISCTNDNEDKAKVSLAGTIWRYSDESGEERTLSFTVSEFIMDYSHLGVYMKWTGIYTYIHSNVTLEFDDGDKMNFIVDGNKMTSDIEYVKVFNNNTTE